MIKLLALDLDGTLLDDQKQISPASVAAIQKAVNLGVKIVLCTGRILNGVQPYFKQLGLDAENEYVILNNGCATHQTSDWSLIDYTALSAADITYLSSFAKGFDLPLTLCDVQRYYVLDEKPNQAILADTDSIFLTPILFSLSDVQNHSAPFFLAKFVGKPDLVKDFQQEYESELSQHFNTVLSMPTIYEMLPKNISKASALQTLTGKLGILPEEVMAIGDANNDLEMLAFAGISIAMKNAPAHVKEIACDITASNNEDGVARAIEKWILQ